MSYVYDPNTGPGPGEIGEILKGAGHCLGVLAVLFGMTQITVTYSPPLDVFLATAVMPGRQLHTMRGATLEEALANLKTHLEAHQN